MLRTWAKRVIPESVWIWRKSPKQYLIGTANQMLLVYYRLFRGSRETVDPILLESLRSEFGEAFGGYIDWRDEMYQLVYDNTSAQGTRKPRRLYGTNRRAIQTSYFVQGKQIRDDLDRILTANGKQIGEISGLLEFASGYGRVTRFLVDSIDPSRVWVADASADALEINATCFGATPRRSGHQPDDFRCERKFEVIFAGMIFSHFNFDDWLLWLVRLYDLVEPAGLLVFSTMGPSLLPDVEIGGYQCDDNGFWFIPKNESSGRLEAESYGCTFVSEAWVSKQIGLHGLGELLSASPKALASWQDVYVVGKPA